MSKSLVTFHYYEADETHKANLRFFLTHGYEADLDYLIVIAGGCTVDLPLLDNIQYEFVPNRQLDFGGISHAIRVARHRGLNRYKYFVFLNSTVRGPFLPPYWKGSWTEPFTDLLVGEVKLVGCTICILSPRVNWSALFKGRYGGAEPYSHVQSMLYAMERPTLEFLLAKGFYSRELDAAKANVIIDYELLLSQTIIQAGGLISCMLPEYQTIDYRKPHSDPNPTSKHGDPSFGDGYFGRAPHPLETIFVKTNRKLAPEPLMAQLAASQAALRPGSSAYGRSRNELVLSQVASAWRGHRNFAVWLTRRLKARAVADLGVDWGYSTFCFAMAGAGHVWGIDSFEGDEHAGARDTQGQVMETAKRMGLSNVSLVKGYFENVAKDWKQPLDILHIDGLHTYEAVKSDFHNWIGFVRDGGVVLLHDTCVPQSGVRRWFDEIELPRTNFAHSHGLGVVSRDPAIVKEIAAVFSTLIEPGSTKV